MPKVYCGCKGLTTQKKEAIVLKFIVRELCPVMEIIERHRTLCHQKYYDLRDLCRNYQNPGQFAGKSTIQGIYRKSKLIVLGENYLDTVMSSLIDVVTEKVERFEQELMEWNTEHDCMVKYVANSPNSVLRIRQERLLDDFLRESLTEHTHQEDDTRILTSMLSELKSFCSL
jgi:hypothetical protein